MNFVLAAICAVIGSVAVQSVHAVPPSPELQSAIQYLDSKVPATQPNSDTEWRANIVRAVQAMQSHPVYSKWLQDDEGRLEKAARAAAYAANAKPVFDCELPKSQSAPVSVHQLRPGDVNVVGAMGDSLTAANGARASNVIGLLLEYRGYAWSIGGEAELRDHTTLPNILRQSNPSLYGQSLANGNVLSLQSRMNVAQPGKTSGDMPAQAKMLVKKLKEDENVDFENDWKIITIFVGGNDVCHYCKDKAKYSVSNYTNHIASALDYLHANVPRAFVNVAEVLDVALVEQLKDGTKTCAALLGSFLCKCAAVPPNAEEAKEIRDLVRDYQNGLRDLVSSGRYDTRDDFTVVNQPFYRNSEPPKIDGAFDISFFAPDCFHFSQRGHDVAAKSLWNNMLEPIGQKSDRWNLESGFICPTETRPYFMTSKNS